VYDAVNWKLEVDEELAGVGEGVAQFERSESKEGD
jgi:hypothetical protein